MRAMDTQIGPLELERQRRAAGQCVGCGEPKGAPHLPTCWTLRFERDEAFGTEYDESDGAA